jgi:hypothetical protein
MGWMAVRLGHEACRFDFSEGLPALNYTDHIFVDVLG